MQLNDSDSSILDRETASSSPTEGDLHSDRNQLLRNELRSVECTLSLFHTDIEHCLANSLSLSVFNNPAHA
jgi:hypothetical protein